jgi:3-oxoacyl-[acyl-carrier protein] reductase
MAERLTKLSRSVGGQVAIVTGAGSGMGRATAHLLADEGAAVAVVDLDQGRVDTVVGEIEGAGGAAVGWAVDISDTAALRPMVDEVLERFGDLHIIVNNAGVSIPAGSTAPPDAFDVAWERSLGVNLTAQAYLVRAAVPHMLDNRYGRIVNIASTETIVTTAGMIPYAASKHGVIGLTKSLAVELGRHGITSNCICPGPIDTNMTAPIPQEAKDEYARRRVPLRRYGDPEEVAQMTLSLVLPAASYLNGAVIAVDGGMSIRHT